MKYVVIHVSACDYPEAQASLFSDRRKALDFWHDSVLDLLGYPDDNPDPEDVRGVKLLAADFIDDASDGISWTIGEGPVEEMTTIQLLALKEEP